MGKNESYLVKYNPWENLKYKYYNKFIKNKVQWEARCILFFYYIGVINSIVKSKTA